MADLKSNFNEKTSTSIAANNALFLIKRAKYVYLSLILGLMPKKTPKVTYSMQQSLLGCCLAGRTGDIRRLA